jgi:hypothetical protein
MSTEFRVAELDPKQNDVAQNLWMLIEAMAKLDILKDFDACDDIGKVWAWANELEAGWQADDEDARMKMFMPARCIAFLTAKRMEGTLHDD